MNITFNTPTIPTKGAYIVLGDENEWLNPTAQTIDATTGGQLSRAANAKHYSGKQGEIVAVAAPANLEMDYLILVGLGKPDEVTRITLEQVGAVLATTLAEFKVARATLHAGLKGDSAAHIACGIKLRNYRFDRYQTGDPEEQPTALQQLSLLSENAADDEKQFQVLNTAVDGSFLARDLVTEPSNVLYPESYAERIAELSKLGLRVEILDEAAMTELGMGALLCVGQGSARASCMVIVHWQGADNADEAPLAIVGKGVTFDSGGISIKPSAGMHDMKFDMGGSAVVVGLMQTLAKRKAKVNVVGVVGLVENMPSSNAVRPGDVVTSLSGQTIEIQNTDAEGRLVLADALWYTQREFAPKLMVDLATLTGAIIGALGDEHAGIFSNTDALCDQLSAAGNSVGEKVWRLPLGKGYTPLVKSDIADLQNLGGAKAGSIVAAEFLQHFVNDVPWVHIDIAGTVWKKDNKPLAGKGATGFGVRLLDEWVRVNYEG